MTEQRTVFFQSKAQVLKLIMQVLQSDIVCFKQVRAFIVQYNTR